MFDATREMEKVQSIFNIRMPVKNVYKFHFLNMQMFKESESEICRGNPDPIKESPYFGMASEAVELILFHAAEMMVEKDPEEKLTPELILLNLGHEYRLFFGREGVWGEAQHRAYFETAETALNNYLEYKKGL